MIRPTRCGRTVLSALEGFIDENDLEVRSRMRDPRSIQVAMYETNIKHKQGTCKVPVVRVVVVAHCCSLEEF